MSRNRNLPALSASDGAVLAMGAKASRNAAQLAFHMIGGVERLAEEADADPKWFFEKIWSKTIQRDVEVDAGEGIERLLDKLDEMDDENTIDAEFDVVDDD